VANDGIRISAQAMYNYMAYVVMDKDLEPFRPVYIRIVVVLERQVAEWRGGIV
jgi:hypothetical protein